MTIPSRSKPWPTTTCSTNTESPSPARWFEKSDRHVADDTTPGGARISTVFLALNHAFGGGPPVLWETMVFDGPLDTSCERYTSRTDALAGHAIMLARALSAELTRPRATCDNCGAPITNIDAKTCAFCGSAYEFFSIGRKHD